MMQEHYWNVPRTLQERCRDITGNMFPNNEELIKPNHNQQNMWVRGQGSGGEQEPGTLTQVPPLVVQQEPGTLTQVPPLVVQQTHRHRTQS